MNGAVLSVVSLRQIVGGIAIPIYPSTWDAKPIPLSLKHRENTMPDEFFIQLFWMISIVTFICLALTIAGVIHYLLTSPELWRLRKLQKAKDAWAKMLTQNRGSQREET